MNSISLAEIQAASAIIRPTLPPTPQYAWPLLGARAACEVWVKHENHTPIGAFKLRGGLYYLHRFKAEGRHSAGLVSATRGNHGQSLALACGIHGVPVTIVVPRGNSQEKNAAMRALGAELIEHGEDFDAAREFALQLSVDRKLEMVPAFHRDLVVGVATYALELFSAVPALATVYCPIGIGSGISGLIRVRDLLGLATEIIGVVAENAPAYALSFAANRIITTPTATTLADGVACRIPAEDAFAEIQRGAARILQVSEREIVKAMQAYFTDTHSLAEGAGAAALAGLLQERNRQRGQRVAVILSGGNIDRELYLKLLRTH
ncbi:MAG: threonine dehydratase [Gammaproteobacteria bacterium]|nr:threonine dehydratase [Gammaproteobacteria bacterium]